MAPARQQEEVTGIKGQEELGKTGGYIHMTYKKIWFITGGEYVEEI
jgi:hypothetical protein